MTQVLEGKIELSVVREYRARATGRELCRYWGREWCD